MGVRNPDGPGPTAARRGKKAVRLDANCKVKIGKVVRSGVAVLTPEELRFNTGRTGREGEDFFVHVRFEHVTSVSADPRTGTLTVATADSGPVTFDLGGLAVPWKAIFVERPDILRELGVTAKSRVALVSVDDEALVAALKRRVRDFSAEGGDAGVDDLDYLFVGVEHRADLARLPALATRVRRPGGVIWLVHPAKGRNLAESDLTGGARAAGLVDGPVVEISPGMLARKLTRL
jgi:hypothetical protein